MNDITADELRAIIDRGPLPIPRPYHPRIRQAADKLEELETQLKSMAALAVAFTDFLHCEDCGEIIGMDHLKTCKHYPAQQQAEELCKN